MSKAKAQKPSNSKIRGLTFLELLFYVFSVPMLLVLSAVMGYQTYQLVPYYTFWPFVGTILAGVITLIFIIVTMCLTLRKKSKRTILKQTVSLVLAVVIMTSGLAVVLDIVLPDVLQSLTSSTLFYEDLTYESEDQAAYNASLDRNFIMLNLLNGNYDGQYSYENLKSNSTVLSNYNTNRNQMMRTSYTTTTYNTVLSRLDEYELELYEFIYDNYIMRDTEYCLLNPDKEFGNSTRMSMGLAMAQYLYDAVYKDLVKEGMMNERIAELFQSNYNSMHWDGYITFDDSFILYATSSRQTVPVIMRLLLDTRFTNTDGVVAYLDESGSVVIPEAAHYFELWDPDAVLAILAAAEVDSSVLSWDSSNTQAILNKTVDGVDYAVGTIIIPYEDESGNVTGGYVKSVRTYCILDMDGNTMSIATISDVVIDLGSILSSLNIQTGVSALDSLISSLTNIEPMTLGELLNLDVIDTALNLVIGEGLTDVLAEVLDLVTDVVVAATGNELYLNIQVNDEGNLVISLSPANVSLGLLGYQFMTYINSNNLLITVCTVTALREWLYIIGAISAVLVLAAGLCREMKAKVRQDYEAAAARAAAGEAPYDPKQAKKDAKAAKKAAKKAEKNGTATPIIVPGATE